MRLNVNYGDRRVGQILEKDGVHYFQYALVAPYRISKHFVDDAIARVETVVKRWPEYASDAEVSTALTEAVDRQLVPVLERFS